MNIICVTDMVSEFTRLLEDAGRTEARLKAEYLVAHFVGCRRLDLLLRKDERLNGKLLKQVQSAGERLVSGEPLQYVLGETEFLGRVFKTDRRALIPRPETEELVGRVLACSAIWSREYPLIADLGTGTGCIAVSLALAQPRARVIAVDISREALALAEENVNRHEVGDRVELVHADLMEDLPDRGFDAVISNPPYICERELVDLAVEIRDYEPSDALNGGPTGMDVISRLVPQAFERLKSGGWIFLEIGEDQRNAVEDLLCQFGFEQIEVNKDIGGQDRIASGMKK